MIGGTPCFHLFDATIKALTLVRKPEKPINKGFSKKVLPFNWGTPHQALISMDCFWAEVITGHLVLKEAEAAKWLTKKQLDSVAWLPADVTLIDKIRACMK